MAQQWAEPGGRVLRWWRPLWKKPVQQTVCWSFLQPTQMTLNDFWMICPFFQKQPLNCSRFLIEFVVNLWRSIKPLLSVSDSSNDSSPEMGHAFL